MPLLFGRMVDATADTSGSRGRAAPALLGGLRGARARGRRVAVLHGGGAYVFKLAGAKLCIDHGLHAIDGRQHDGVEVPVLSPSIQPAWTPADCTPHRLMFFTRTGAKVVARLRVLLFGRMLAQGHGLVRRPGDRRSLIQHEPPRQRHAEAPGGGDGNSVSRAPVGDLRARVLRAPVPDVLAPGLPRDGGGAVLDRSHVSSPCAS